eukprot:scaffold1867_cov247-Pinguiococcus_pyrenoidosus.AAC.5
MPKELLSSQTPSGSSSLVGACRLAPLCGDDYLCDLAGFVVPPQNEHSLREAHFESDEKGHRLDAVVSSIHVVSQKQVVGVRGMPPNAKELHQIVKLAVDVATDGHWRAHGLNVALRAQHVLGSLT